MVSTVRLEGPPHMRWGEPHTGCVLPLQLCRLRYVSENMVLLLPSFCYLEEAYWNHQPNQLPVVIVDRGTWALAGFQSCCDGNCSVVDCRPPIQSIEALLLKGAQNQVQANLGCPLHGALVHVRPQLLPVVAHLKDKGGRKQGHFSPINCWRELPQRITRLPPSTMIFYIHQAFIGLILILLIWML